MTTVAIVEDNLRIRQSLQEWVDSEPDYRCICACGDAETAILAQQFFALGNVGHLADSDLPARKFQPDFIFSRPAAFRGLMDDGVSEEIGEVGNREYDLVYRHVLPGRDDFLKGPQTDD